MKIQKIVNVDLHKSAFSCPIRVVQYDTGVQLIFKIMGFEIPSGTTAKVFVLKPSGKFVYQEDDITIADNTITIDVDNQAFSEHGRVRYQVELLNGSDSITTFARIIEVEQKLNDAGAEESKTVIKAFDKLTDEKVSEFETRAEEIVQTLIETIPDDYNEMVENVDYLYDNVANAIKNNVSGSVVVVDNVSPIKHKPIVRVHGKNMFDTSKIEVTPVINEEYANITAVGENYVDITVTDQYNGNGHVAINLKLKDICPQMVAGKTYFISANSDAWNKCLYLKQLDYFWNFGNALTITEEMLECTLGLYGYATYRGQDPGTCKISNIQIEEGEIATEYTPYINPTIATVKRCGKNIYEVTAKTQTTNGVTFTVNDDGSVKVNGTASKTTFIGLGTLNVKAGEKYRLSGSPSGSAFDTYMLYIHNNTTGADIYDLGNGKVFEGKDGDQGLVIVVYEGTTVNNLMFYPLVVYGEEISDFEPYIGAEYTPNADGFIEDITSVSPNMTIFTDTDGIIVDCEYNVNTRTFIENIVKDLGGGLDLSAMTLKVDAVAGGNQLSISDGVTTKTVVIPAVSASTSDIERAVNAYLADNPIEVNVPTKLSDLTDDSTHRTVTDTEKNTWNNKANRSDIPTTLPNPKALTFTGAVTGNYNGSNELEINIPSGATEPTEPTEPTEILQMELTAEQAEALSIEFTAEQYPELANYNTINIFVKAVNNGNAPWMQTVINGMILQQAGPTNNSTGKKVRVWKKGKMYNVATQLCNPDTMDISRGTLTMQNIGEQAPRWVDCGEVLNSIKLSSHTKWLEEGTKIAVYGWNE